MNQCVSVIIPTYQGEKYINRAIDSVLNQTYQNTQIIVVDDGSTDNTKSALEQYKANEKIQYVFKENGGLSDARNVGLRHARGMYVYFLDSDDWIEERYLEKMVGVAVNQNADIVLSSIIITDGKTETFRADSFIAERIKDENIRNFYTPMYFHPIMQNKLFRREFLQTEHLQFPYGLHYEDVYFFTAAFEKAAIIGRAQDAKFYYFQHPHSIMKQATIKLLDIERIFQILLEDFPHFKDERWFEYLTIRHLYLASTLRAIKGNDKKILQTVRQSHSQFIEQHFPRWRQNQFLKQRCLYQSTGQYLYVQVIRIFGYKIGSMLAKYIV